MSVREIISKVSGKARRLAGAEHVSFAPWVDTVRHYSLGKLGLDEAEKRLRTS